MSRRDIEFLNLIEQLRSLPEKERLRRSEALRSLDRRIKRLDRWFFGLAPVTAILIVPLYFMAESLFFIPLFTAAVVLLVVFVLYVAYRGTLVRKALRCLDPETPFESR